MRRAERQEQVLRAAARAFARDGFSATSMEDVAAEAGITKLIVYRHFASKEDLYRAALERTSRRLAEEFAAGVASGGRGAAVRSLLTVAREDPAGFVLVYRHAARETQFAGYAAQVRPYAVELARRLLPDAVARSPLAPWAAESVVGHLVDAVLNWVELGRPADDERFIAVVAAGVPALVDAWGRTIRD